TGAGAAAAHLREAGERDADLELINRRLRFGLGSWRRWDRVEREGDVVLAAGGIDDAGPAIEVRGQVGAVGDAAAANVAAASVAHGDSVARVAAAVEIAQRRGPTVGEAVAGAAVAGGRRLIIGHGAHGAERQAERDEHSDQ